MTAVSMVASAHAPAIHPNTTNIHRRESMNVRRIVAMTAATALCGVAFAQAPIPQYGPNVTLDQARKAAAAAEAEAKKNSWPMAIAILLPCSFWFARNLWITGNPLYPLDVSLFNHRILCGW